MRIGGWSAAANRWELDMSGNNWVASSFRAPIFYDSNDTSYYVDPSSTSNIVNLRTTDAVSNNINGLRNINPGGGSYVTSASTVSGAIRIALPQSVYPMIRFTVRVYTYDGLSFDIYCGGHTSSNYWYNTFAYMGTQNRSALNVRFTSDGSTMYVYIGELGSSWSYPQVFITEVQVGYTNYEYDRWDNGWAITFNASSYNSVQATHTVYPPTSSTNNTNAAYASILYDANNTGYYADPANISNFNQINMQGVLRRNTSAAGYLEGNYPTSTDSNSSACIYTIGGSYQPGGTNLGNMYGIGYTVGNGSANPGLGLGGWGMYVASGGVSRIFLDSDGGIVISSGSMRTPIFYDSNNTAYYTDPASTSVLNALTLGGRSTTNAMFYQGFTLDANTMATNATGFTYSVNAPYTGPIARFSTDGSYDLWLNAPYSGGGYGLAFRTRNGDTGSFNSWRYPAVYDINVNGGGALYATIYYDQNNTGYYCDPASTSNLNAVVADSLTVTSGSAYIRANRSSSGSGQVGFNWAQGGTNLWWNYVDTSGTTLNWYNSVSGSNIMTLTTGGSLTASGNIAANSDERLKKDWADLADDFVEQVAKVKAGTYTRIDSGERQAGSSAQDWQKLLPEVVHATEDEDKTLSLAYGNAALVAAVKLAQRVVEQDARIARLESLLDKLIGDQK
jgi:hypothetical protein